MKLHYTRRGDKARERQGEKTSDCARRQYSDNKKSRTQGVSPAFFYFRLTDDLPSLRFHDEGHEDGVGWWRRWRGIVDGEAPSQHSCLGVGIGHNDIIHTHR